MHGGDAAEDAGEGVCGGERFEEVVFLGDALEIKGGGGGKPRQLAYARLSRIGGAEMGLEFDGLGLRAETAEEAAELTMRKTAPSAVAATTALPKEPLSPRMTLPRTGVRSARSKSSSLNFSSREMLAKRS